MKQLLFVLLLISTLANAQKAGRVSRSADYLVLQDSAAVRPPRLVPYTNAGFIASGNYLYITIQGAVYANYTASQFLNASGTPYSTVSTSAALNAFLASVPTSGTGGSGGSFSGNYLDLYNRPVIPTVPTSVTAFTNEAGYQRAIDVANAIANKVDVVSGKGLSANDYSSVEKFKLAGIASGATVNSTDAQLRDRSTHTGVQSASTITQDASNRFSTDVEKSAWTAKQNALVSGTTIRTINGSSLLGSGDIVITGGGGATALPYDVSFATNSTDLNAAIAASTKSVLLVANNSITITSKLILSGKNGFTLRGNNTTLLLNTDTNDGNKGVILDIQTGANLTVEGFFFNCTLPSTSTDGAGYGLVTVNPGAVVSNLTIRRNRFTCPNYDQNAFSGVTYSPGNTGGFIQSGRIYDNDFGFIKRMAIEVTNQQVNDNPNPTSRYDDFRVFGNRAHDLGCNGGVNGMFISLDGLGTNNYVGYNQVINPKFYCFEVVGNIGVNFENNTCDYTPGYSGVFAAYSFTDGGHGAAYGAQNVTVNGGFVRCTGRGINVSRASNCNFYNVNVSAGGGNNFVQATNCTISGGTWIGDNTGEYQFAYMNGSSGNRIVGATLNNLQSNGNGAKCILVYFGGGDVGNTFSGNRLFQERNSGNGFAENIIINAQTNRLQDNFMNNTSTN